tara:strand:- start:419 stop:538 length:120 start_codon:yes stop_codon:yes gene_type:complete
MNQEVIEKIKQNAIGKICKPYQANQDHFNACLVVPSRIP